jgi:hypothetical protein
VAYWLEVTKRGVNEKPKVFVNSGGSIVQSRFRIIRLFRRVVIIDTFGNVQRNRVRQRFGFGDRLGDWFGYYERLRN